MAEDGFRLPASSFEELCKIIKGYGHHNGPAVPEDIKKLTGINPTTVSRNNAFLLESGIIEGGKKKLITISGRALSRALEHEMPSEIENCWREVVSNNEFFEKLISAIRIRKGMEESTLKAHVAYSAGQPKKPEVMTGAGTVVDILRASGLIKEEGGKLVAVTSPTNGSPKADSSEPSTAQGHNAPIHNQQVAPVNQQQIASKNSFTSPLTSTNIEASNVAISIQIQIHCNADEVDRLGPKLRTMLEELAKPSADTDNNNDTAENLPTEDILESELDTTDDIHHVNDNSNGSLFNSGEAEE